MTTGGVPPLVIRAPNWLGDAVMALPAIAAVRRALAGRTLVIAALPAVAPIFEEQTPAAPDAVLTIDGAGGEAAQIRGIGAGTILLLPNSFGSAWVARRSGVPERWGYRAGGRHWLLTRSVSRPRTTVHQIRYYLDLVTGLGFEGGEPTPRMAARPATLASGDALLRAAGLPQGQRIVGFAPGAAYGGAKRWPPARVAEVIAALERQGIAAVMVGAGADRITGRAIQSSLPSDTHLVNLIGRTTIRQLVGVVARCAAFVSNDSGAMHVAAALGVPLTAIFGPTDDRVTAPGGGADIITRQVFCRPCMLRECPIDHRCMKRIDADSILRSVTAHLAGPVT